MQLAHFVMFMLCAKVRGGVKKDKEKRAPKARVIFLVAPQGFEPRLIGSEPTVLPLNEGATN
jgi:hypothetical protein